MQKHIVILPGDGIGPEITDGAVAVLKTVAQKFDHAFDFTYLPIGLSALDAAGDPLPQSTVDGCLAADSVLLGAVGGAVNDPKYNALPAEKRPETGLLKIRKAMGVYSNIRPAKLWAALNHAPVLPEHINCQGCRADWAKTVFCEQLCAVRRCARQRGVVTCGDCPEMESCPTVGAIFTNNPQAKENIIG